MRSCASCDRSDGMVEEIITTFSRVRWLLVIDAMMTLVDRELIISGLRLAAAEAE